MSEIDGFTKGWLEAGGYDPDKLCEDEVTARLIVKGENMLTGDIDYILKCEGPYETFKDVILDGPEHVMAIFNRFNMEKVGEWRHLGDATVGELATWSCGHDIMQDSDYWI